MSVVTRTVVAEEPRLDAAKYELTYWGAAGVLGALAVLAVGVDVAVSNAFLIPRENDKSFLPGDMRKFVSLSEFFGYGGTVALIVLAMYVLDRARRSSIPRLIACAGGAGMLADLLKLPIGRMRPIRFDRSLGVMDSFLGLFATFTIKVEKPLKIWNLQSFPSGHTALSVGLAIGLSRIYPHGRWLFASCAMFVALQRVESGAHWVSDTLAGAAIAFVWAGMLEWFSRQRWQPFQKFLNA